MNIEHSGQRYSATVPDTLDLAERARLAIRGFAGFLDPELDFLPFGLVFWASRTPYMTHWASADVGCGAKICESFPLLRLMSGSDEHADSEVRMREAFMARIQDGLFWDLHDPRRPWRNVYGHSDKRYGPGRAEDFCVPSHAARMMRAVMVCHELTGDDRFRRAAADLLHGMRRIAIDRDDYSYYPEKGGWCESTAYPRSGWINTDESLGEAEGEEGSVSGYHAHPVYAAAAWYRRTGDPAALELATRMANYCLKPRFWGGVPDADLQHARDQGLPDHIAARLPDPACTAGAELGHWYSHFHARATVLRGLLEYARVTGNDRILEFVRRGYEFSLSQGIARLGWVTCHPVAMSLCEACALGDLVALGIRLTDAGAGDYWDDVDGVVRNHLAEQQATRADLLERIAAASPEKHPEETMLPNQFTRDNVLARTLGLFIALAKPNAAPAPWSALCCCGNATQGLYYAWEGAVREERDTAQVNLLLNRAARLLDVESCLPYEGKVVIRNKAARRIAVRMPAWVARRELRLEVSGTPATPDWIGHYLVFCRLPAGAAITVEFPLPETSARYTVSANTGQEQAFTCSFRGSDLVDISPKDEDPRSLPFYQRSRVRSGRAPMKTVLRFVPDRVVREW